MIKHLLTIYFHYMTVAVSGMLLIIVILFFYAGFITGNITFTSVITGVVAGLSTLFIARIYSHYFLMPRGFLEETELEPDVSDSTNIDQSPGPGKHQSSRRTKKYNVKEARNQIEILRHQMETHIERMHIEAKLEIERRRIQTQMELEMLELEHYRQRKIAKIEMSENSE